MAHEQQIRMALVAYHLAPACAELEPTVEEIVQIANRLRLDKIPDAYLAKAEQIVAAYEATSRQSAPAKDRPTVAFPGELRIWLVGGLLCPHCRRQLHANDVTVDDGDVALICAGCRRDVLNITEATSAEASS